MVQGKADWYQDIVEGVASQGFVVVQYDPQPLKLDIFGKAYETPLLEFLDAETEVGYGKKDGLLLDLFDCKAVVVVAGGFAGPLAIQLRAHSVAVHRGTPSMWLDRCCTTNTFL